MLPFFPLYRGRFTATQSKDRERAMKRTHINKQIYKSLRWYSLSHYLDPLCLFAREKKVYLESWSSSTSSIFLVHPKRNPSFLCSLLLHIDKWFSLGIWLHVFVLRLWWFFMLLVCTNPFFYVFAFLLFFIDLWWYKTQTLTIFFNRQKEASLSALTPLTMVTSQRQCDVLRRRRNRTLLFRKVLRIKKNATWWRWWWRRNHYTKMYDRRCRMNVRAREGERNENGKRAKSFVLVFVLLLHMMMSTVNEDDTVRTYTHTHTCAHRQARAIIVRHNKLKSSGASHF